MKKPDFNKFLKMLKREDLDNPIPFEFLIDLKHGQIEAKDDWISDDDPLAQAKNVIKTFYHLGYDYSFIYPWLFDSIAFPVSNDIDKKKSIGQAHCGIIKDEKSFEEYKWPEISDLDYSIIDEIAENVPDGMKSIIAGPGGVLENLIALCGFEDLCFMLFDKPELVKEITDNIGKRLYQHYERALQSDCIGAVMVNDDWGFKTSLSISPDDMRKYIIPWHKKFAELARKNGVPAIMHSCGNLDLVWDDIINEIKFDGKHSYEDNILPVEDAYKKYGDKIAILGGIDMHFMSTAAPEEITKRAEKLMELTNGKGYALGVGNSVTNYIPHENYMAMLNVIRG